MQINTFKEMYLAELQELASAERQLVEAQARMTEMATHAALKNALASHREQSEAQTQRLESILQKHGASATEHTDQGMQALINETEKMLAIVQGEDLRDAGLIASAQRLAHYEMAAYGTAAALAGQLELRDDQQALHESLEEERQCDALLTQLAKQEVNPDAVGA